MSDVALLERKMHAEAEATRLLNVCPERAALLLEGKTGRWRCG